MLIKSKLALLQAKTSFKKETKAIKRRALFSLKGNWRLDSGGKKGGSDLRPERTGFIRGERSFAYEEYKNKLTGESYHPVLCSNRSRRIGAGVLLVH